MPISNGHEEEEEETFAVLCIYSQLVVVGLMWWVGFR